MCIQITHTNNQQDAEVQVQGIILKKYTDDTNPLAKGPHSVVHYPPVQMVFEVEMSSILVESSNHDGCVGYGSPN